MLGKTLSLGKISLSAALQATELAPKSRSIPFLQYYSTTSTTTALLCKNLQSMSLSRPITNRNNDMMTNSPATGGGGLSPVFGPLLIPSRSFAARKGTRTRKEKKKVKKVEVKKTFVFKNIRKLAEMPYKKQRPFDKSHYPEPLDNVFFLRKYQTKCWSFTEAVQNFKETHHPTVYNVPEAPLILRMNVDLTYPNRPNKFQEGWRSVIEMKEAFLLPGMARPSVIAFCIEDNDYIAEVLKAGADLAGGKELIKSIQEGEVDANDYEYIVSHPTMVPELTVIRGVIKKKFPMVKNRTISADLVAEVKRLRAGIKVRLEKNDREPDFGFFETPIGTLNMSTENLEANFLSVLSDTVPRRVSGKAPENFVISCVLKTPDTGFEEFNIDVSSYLSSLKPQSKKSVPSGEEEEEHEENAEKISASQ